jgi:hypothetical protein
MCEPNFSAEFLSAVSNLYRPRLVTHVRDENEGTLRILEEADLNYIEVHLFISSRPIPEAKSRSQLISIIYKILAEAEGTAQAIPLPSFPYGSITKTLDQITSIINAPFLSDSAKGIMMREFIRIYEGYDVSANIKKFEDTLIEYKERTDETITTERYAVGEAITLIDDYFRKDLCSHLTQRKSFELIADFFNAYDELKIEANKGENFTYKRIKHLHDNFRRLLKEKPQ